MERTHRLRAGDDRLPWRTKVRLTGRIWWAFAQTYIRVRRSSLPSAILGVGATHSASSRDHVDPRRVGRIVYRVSHVRGHGPRCLYNAIVLYGLLRRQGDKAQVVIGLPIAAIDKDAHAWVEVGGQDVGPPPGQAGHQELARYG